MTNRTNAPHVSLLLATILLILAGFCLTACNAVQGAGRDISEIGEAGQKAIDGG